MKKTEKKKRKEKKIAGLLFLFIINQNNWLVKTKKKGKK